jgi:hypothetical protein
MAMLKINNINCNECKILMTESDLQTIEEEDGFDNSMFIKKN